MWTDKDVQGCTTLAGQLNSICFLAPDGSEGTFQLINNGWSTCIKLNQWLLVIMNVLMDLSDRSGPQTVSDSFVVCMFFPFFSFLSVLQSLSYLSNFSAFSCPILFRSQVLSHAVSLCRLPLLSFVIKKNFIQVMQKEKPCCFLSFFIRLNPRTFVSLSPFMNI